MYSRLDLMVRWLHPSPSAALDGKTWSDVAWCYEDPLPECPRIKGLVSFYAETLDALTVDGRPASMQRV